MTTNIAADAAPANESAYTKAPTVAVRIAGDSGDRAVQDAKARLAHMDSVQKKITAFIVAVLLSMALCAGMTILSIKRDIRANAQALTAIVTKAAVAAGEDAQRQAVLVSHVACAETALMGKTSPMGYLLMGPNGVSDQLSLAAIQCAAAKGPVEADRMRGVLFMAPNPI